MSQDPKWWTRVLLKRKDRRSREIDSTDRFRDEKATVRSGSDIQRSSNPTEQGPCQDLSERKPPHDETTSLHREDTQDVGVGFQLG